MTPPYDPETGAGLMVVGPMSAFSDKELDIIAGILGEVWRMLDSGGCSAVRTRCRVQLRAVSDERGRRNHGEARSR